MLNNPIYAAVLSVFLMMSGWVYLLKTDIAGLTLQLEETQVKLGREQMQSALHVVSINSQNKAIAMLEVDINASKTKLAEWKALPTKVRYEVIYRDVVKENNLTGDCDEVKNLINSVSSINLNGL